MRQHRELLRAERERLMESMPPPPTYYSSGDAWEIGYLPSPLDHDTDDDAMSDDEAHNVYSSHVSYTFHYSAMFLFQQLE